MKKYVVGFAFTKDKKWVLLQKKNRPEFQNGRLNGIGGKVKNNENPFDAMNRESKEETGLVLNWVYRGILKGINTINEVFECHIFYAFDDNIINFQQIEDEVLAYYVPFDILNNKYKTLNNAKLLISHGVSDDIIPFLTLHYHNKSNNM